MARKYVLDTNLYIDAIRNSLKEQALEGFLERNAPMTYMSAVVMQELRAGAVTDEQAKVLQHGIFEVFERRNRVVGLSGRSPHEQLSADHGIEIGAGDGNRTHTGAGSGA